jgi:hypothetical protein
VVPRAYLDVVERGLRAFGLPDPLAAATDGPRAPVRELIRVDLP